MVCKGNVDIGNSISVSHGFVSFFWLTPLLTLSPNLIQMFTLHNWLPFEVRILTGCRFLDSCGTTRTHRSLNKILKLRRLFRNLPIFCLEVVGNGLWWLHWFSLSDTLLPFVTGWVLFNGCFGKIHQKTSIWTLFRKRRCLGVGSWASCWRDSSWRNMHLRQVRNLKIIFQSLNLFQDGVTLERIQVWAIFWRGWIVVSRRIRCIRLQRLAHFQIHVDFLPFLRWIFNILLN